MTIDPQALLAAVTFFAVVMLLKICFAFVPYVLDEELFNRAMSLFEPRWKREARYFASLIPDACAYCGNDPDPSVICPACYAQLQERRA